MSEDEGVGEDKFHFQSGGENFRVKEAEGSSEVFQKVLGEAKEKIQYFRTDLREDNRIAVVLSAYNAKSLLPQTLRETTDQLRQSNLEGEIFVILNNEGGDTKEYLHSDLDSQYIKEVANDIGVDEIIFGETKELDETSQNSRAIPRNVVLEKPISPRKNGLSLIVIEQQEGPDNLGKIRGLRDVYEFLRIQNQETGYCPRYLLAIDAETRLRPVDSKKKRIEINNNSGLAHMIEVSERGRKMVGAKLQFVPYDEKGNPHWEERTPPMQEVTSIIHGKKGYEWLPGGGTLGGFPEMVAILNTISQDLPGTRIEDVLATVTARELGIETVIDFQVVHANKCPRESEREDVLLQMKRWLRGAEGLKAVTGIEAAQKVIDNKILALFIHPLSELARGRKMSVPHLLKGLPKYLELQRLARKHPDDYVGGPATF